MLLVAICYHLPDQMMFLFMIVSCRPAAPPNKKKIHHEIIEFFEDLLDDATSTHVLFDPGD
jgi:hypothetical protein